MYDDIKSAWPHINRLLITLLMMSVSWGAIRSVEASVGAKTGQQDEGLAHYDRVIQETLNHYCTDCHYKKKQEGQVRLDNFLSLAEPEKIKLIDRIEEQVFTGAMPPEKEDAVEPDEREAFLSAITKRHVLTKTKSGLIDKLKKPGYGNYVDHDKLFSGDYKHLKGYTEDRHWLISEYIFNEKIMTLISGGDRKKRFEGKLYKSNGGVPDRKYVNPFKLPDRSGVRYFANEKISSGHFLSMIDNAVHVANAMNGHLAQKYKDFLPTSRKITDKIVQKKAALRDRITFIEIYIDDLCAEIYQSQNDAYLPGYEKLEIGKIDPKARKYGKHGWKGRIATDGDAVRTAVLKFRDHTKSDLAIIEKSERYWRHYGEQDSTVNRRVRLLEKEVASIKATHRNKKSLIYKRPNASEMKIISGAIRRHRRKGMPYKALIQKCKDEWFQQIEEEARSSDLLTDQMVAQMLSELYRRIYQREITRAEISEQSVLFRDYVGKIGIEGAVRKATQTLLLSSEFISRNEYGAGKPDQFGRRLLAPRDAAYAISYALTDSAPDEQLMNAALNGRLLAKADYEREVLRMLGDRSHIYVIDPFAVGRGIDNFTMSPIRIHRFFREFFGYPKSLTIFKDIKRFGSKGLDSGRRRLVAEADMLVKHILDEDKDVFRRLLTTEEFYLYHSGNNEQVKQAAAKVREVYDYFESRNWRTIKTFSELTKHSAVLKSTRIYSFGNLKKVTNKKHQSGVVKLFHEMMQKLSAGYGKNEMLTSFGVKGGSQMVTTSSGPLGGGTVFKFYGKSLDGWQHAKLQPAPVPFRKGILTHPAWLMAHAQNTETDPVIRGKWVREKLLAGTVPDVPITVDAVIPEDHTKTLRQRLDARTHNDACWRCHQYMNPLGITFENYDDFGRYRTDEEIEHPLNVLNKEEEARKSPFSRPAFPFRYKTLPVNARGELTGTGDDKLDGKVNNALEMIDRLGQSDRVRQSMIRYAFRYFMGRNERLSDSKTLIDADEAYLKSGGSFNAVVVSLLTSDSFMYRKPSE